MQASQAEATQVPLLPFLKQRPADLSDCLKDIDQELHKSGDKSLKPGHLIPNPSVQMGWYKVPRSAFDYALSSVNPILMDVGMKEKEVLGVPIPIYSSSNRMPGPCPWCPCSWT